MKKPFSEACENNKHAILGAIKPYLTDVGSVLELGSGTGQHAVYFAQQLQHLIWQTSDLEPHLAGISQWLDEAAHPNLPPPLALDINQPWPILAVEAIFTANTFHIMSWAEVCRMILKASETLPMGGYFIVYGPFKYDGQYNAESDRRFDEMLHQRDALSGLRDIVDIVEQMAANGFELREDIPMPANNRCHVWQLIHKS